MGSGLWGGEHVHIAIHIVIHTSICPSKQSLVDFVAYKLFYSQRNYKQLNDIDIRVYFETHQKLVKQKM